MSIEFHLPTDEEMRMTKDGLEMLHMIDKDDLQMAILTGVPGSGKTTVSIKRLIRLINQDKKALLVTYQRLLVFFIRNIPHIHASETSVNTFNSWYTEKTEKNFPVKSPPSKKDIRKNFNILRDTYSDTELLIDEGQDLPGVVYKTLPNYFKCCVVGADNGQKVHKHGAKSEDIEKILRGLEQENFKKIELGHNFRNTYEIYRFARQFIPRTNKNAWNETILERLKRNKKHGKMPEVVTYTKNTSRDKHLKTFLNNAEGNVALLCPLVNSVNEIYNVVSKMGFSVTKFHNGIEVIPKKIERYIVTTYVSAKGLEFDEVILFLPRKHSKDIDEQLYVASTRSKRRLAIYRDMKKLEHDPIAEFDQETYKGINLD